VVKRGSVVGKATNLLCLETFPFAELCNPLSRGKNKAVIVRAGFGRQHGRLSWNQRRAGVVTAAVLAILFLR